MNMKRKTAIFVLFAVLLVFLVSCNNTEQNTPLESSVSATVPPEIKEDLKVDASELSSRELKLVESINDVEMRDFTLPDFGGTEHTLSDYKGEIIILNFWAIGCPPCVNEMPDFSKVAQREGVVLVTVAQKDILGNEKTQSFEFIKDFETVALWDENLTTAGIYPSQYYPHTYIIDRQGIIRFVLNSASYELLNELVSFCDENLN